MPGSEFMLWGAVDSSFQSSIWGSGGRVAEGWGVADCLVHSRCVVSGLQRHVQIMFSQLLGAVSHLPLLLEDALRLVRGPAALGLEGEQDRAEG